MGKELNVNPNEVSVVINITVRKAGKSTNTNKNFPKNIENVRMIIMMEMLLRGGHQTQIPEEKTKMQK